MAASIECIRTFDCCLALAGLTSMSCTRVRSPIIMPMFTASHTPMIRVPRASSAASAWTAVTLSAIITSTPFRPVPTLLSAVPTALCKRSIHDSSTTHILCTIWPVAQQDSRRFMERKLNANPRCGSQIQKFRVTCRQLLDDSARIHLINLRCQLINWLQYGHAIGKSRSDTENTHKGQSQSNTKD
jgi:hypothetical protein